MYELVTVLELEGDEDGLQDGVASHSELDPIDTASS